MGHIFISYRRDDSAGHAGRLQEALEARFGAHAVFRDVEDLVPGLSFSAALDARLDAASVVLVMIGPRWLDAERDGQRRLALEDDYVRLEVARALMSDKPVIPVLLGGADMPTRDQLPDPLKPLVDRHAVRLDDEGWQDDATRLANTLSRWMPAPTPWARARPRKWLPVAFALLAGGLFLAWPKGPDVPAGIWAADVRYDWGPVVQERFILNARGDHVVGSASFLGVPRPIIDARWDGEVLVFETHTESELGDETRQLRHRYLMQHDANSERWQIDYTIDGGFTPVAPMHFPLTRVGDAP